MLLWKWTFKHGGFIMEANKIREYIMVKDNFSHAKLEEVGCYDYSGELRYTDCIYNMLNESFKMDSLITEVSYVIGFDYKKLPKGICKVGQGGLGETPTPMQPIFTFLLLTGASSFIVVHNHISDMPQASESDKTISKMLKMIASGFDMEFIGHMIINPNGYIIDGGTMDGIVAEIDEDGEIVSWDSKEAKEEHGEEYSEEEYKELISQVEADEPPFDDSEGKTIRITSENMYEVAQMLRKRAERR